ncbi:hypothetical protein RHS04_00365, partial [Rhizoctonia solani]
MPQVPVLLTFDNLFLHLHPPSKPPFHHPTVLSPREHLSLASNAQQRQTLACAQRRQACNAQKAACKAAQGLESGYESLPDQTQAKHTHDSQDLTNQEETLANGLTLQQVIRLYATAQLLRELDHPLDLPTHLPRLLPPLVHSSLTVISSLQPVATGLGHHITHPAITKSEYIKLPFYDMTIADQIYPGQTTRLINANQSRAKRPWIKHALSNTKTNVPKAKDNHIFITSSPFASPHSSCPPSPLSQQDPQVPPEDTQTVPEDLEVDQVNIQTVPKTSTQHPVLDIAGPTTWTLSQALPVSLGAPTSDPPHSPITTTTANHLQSSTQAPPSQHARVTQVQPATNRCCQVSQPAPPTSTQPEPINVADGLPPTCGWTRTCGGCGRGSAVRVGEGLHVMLPGERAIPRSLGIRREGALVVPAPTLPDISLQRNSQSIGIASQPRTQTPSASQQTSNPPNRPPTAPAPCTTPGPSNINQPDCAPTTPQVSGTRPPTGNRQPPPKTLAGPLLSSLTRPNLPYLANRWAIQGKHPGLNPVARGDNRGARQAQAQVAALILSNPIVTRPTPENGAELVLDNDEEQAAEAAVAQGREP